MRLGSTIGRFGRNAEGGMAVLAATCLVIVLGVAALGVDLGKFVVDRRKAQSIADLAALAAASDIGNAASLASSTVTVNAVVPIAPLTVDLGAYQADVSVTSQNRFQTATSPSANAVRVTLQTQTELSFAKILTGRATYPITAQAVAATTSFASFAIGSRLARLDGGILNQLLGGLLGTSLSLSALDYQSLLDAKIDVFDFLNALAVRGHVTGPTFNSVLTTNLTTGTVLNAIIDAGRLNSTVSSSALWALTSIQNAVNNSSQTVPIGSVVSLGPYSGLGVGTKPLNGMVISAFDLVSASAQIANGTRQVALGLNLNVLGIAGASVSLAIGEQPVGSSRYAVGKQGVSAQTAQVRLLLQVLALGVGPVSVINLPIYVEVARGIGTLNALRCGYPDVGTSSVTLGVTPGIVDAWIGSIAGSDFTSLSTAMNPSPAALVNLGVLQVTARAHATMGNTSPTSFNFSYADIQSQTKKTATTTNFTTSLTASLLSDLTLGAKLAGLTVSLPAAVGQGITVPLSALTIPLDQTLASLLAALGIGLGQADVWVDSIRCDGAVLVR